jgi:hypothetical protein
VNGLVFIIKKFIWMFNKIKYAIRDMFSLRKGTIDFTAGEWEVFVHIRTQRHERIDFDIEECEQSTCGHSPRNHFSIDQNQNGFLLKAEIESDKVKFHWFVK